MVSRSGNRKHTFFFGLMSAADLCNTSLMINCICLSCVSQLFPNPPSSVTQAIIVLPSKMSLHGMSEYTFTVFTLFVAFNLLRYEKNGNCNDKLIYNKY